MTFGTISADGNTVDHKVGDDTGNAQGFRFHASGTFGGGTLTLAFKGGDGTYRAIESGDFTAAVDRIVEIDKGTTVRASLTGATAPSVYYEFNDFSK